ncbi:MAG TPA: hypothetical protein VED18_09060 [Candidatus Sulfotelmatobacter sp.]|nr:hypothetical protein [Candidatus Sulfotelmatobacter sp.]
MRGLCAWCGKELQTSSPGDPSTTTHGICEDCFLGLRVSETLKRLQPEAGPYPIFVPPNRDDLVLRLRREGPPGCSFLVYTDLRRGERRGQRRPVPGDRRTGRDRRSGNLSFLPSRPPDPRLP